MSGEGVVFQTSLFAAFIAGMVALFAPCCITFLLPAYLGSVFKEKEKVIFMTFIFGLGIFVVLLPAVLGVAFISQTLFRYHDTVYLLGAYVLIAVGVVTFLGIKLPMPSFNRSGPQKADVWSIFTLGIFSGITSACCAPVLIGILTLTFLSPNFFGALSIGGMYVLGMVVPLFLISLFLSGKVTKLSLLKKSIASFTFLGRKFQIIVSNLIASLIFFATGILIFVLTLQGKLAMENTEGFTRMIQNVALQVDTFLGQSMGDSVVVIFLIAVVIYIIIKKA